MHYIPEIPDDLSEREKQIATFNSQVSNRLIAFGCRNAQAFIEPLGDYEERQDKLIDGSEKTLITAVMVGELDQSAPDLQSLLADVPIDLLPLLSMVTGKEIGAPWVEFRDADGDLTARVHRSFGCVSFVNGRGAIKESVHGSTGRFLTVAQGSDHYGTSELRVVARHLVRSGLNGTSVEDRLIHAVRALECLLNMHDIPAPILLEERLRRDVREKLETHLSRNVRDIQALRDDSKICGYADEYELLNQILEKVRQSSSVKPGFAKSILILLKHHEFPDAMIVNHHYEVNPPSNGRKRWERAIAAYRGAAMHDGFIDFSADQEEVKDVIIMITHLRDLLIRIVLKTLQYDGPYQPLVEIWTAIEPIDWVKPETPAHRFGYR
jgi:hypothetical protein